MRTAWEVNMVQKVEDTIIKKIVWPQYVASIAVTILMVEIGLMSGWTSPYTAQLESSESPMKLTEEEIAWIVSLLNAGRLMGALVGAVLVNYLGSKTAVLITNKPIAVYWICTIVANDVRWLYVARFCGGLSLGMCYCCFSLYLAEIANPNIRGALTGLSVCGMSLGNLIISIMGTYLKMEITGVINLVLSVALCVMLLLLPESPHYHIRKKNVEKAKKSILWYHPDCDVENELAALTDFVAASEKLSFLESLKEMSTPVVRKALLVSLGLYVYSQVCGLNNVLFQMENILTKAKVTIMKPAHVVIMVMVFGIGASLVSMVLVDRFGRRFLMCVSCTLVSVSLAGMGAQFFLIDAGHDGGAFQWLPIASVVIFQVALYVGIVPVPSTVAGEIFPPKVKYVAAALGSLTAGVCAFVSTSTFKPLVERLTMKYTLWLYGLILVTAVPITMTFVPETKGKTLQQIQDKLMSR